MKSYYISVKFLSALLIMALVFAILPVQSAYAASVLYVKPTGTGTGDCSSWTNACTLQSALSTAASGDDIWVMQGTYIPGTNRTDAFQLVNNVGVYGGFNGTETALIQRNPAINLTILSGDINGDDTGLVVDGSIQNNGDNNYHVVTANSPAYLYAVLDGFTITAGNANGGGDAGKGGGILINTGNSAPALKNLTFYNNIAVEGGGVYSGNFTYPTFHNITFDRNKATTDGGGLRSVVVWQGTLENITFSENVASGDGGAIQFNGHSSGPSFNFHNITFYNNDAGGNGDAIRFETGNANIKNSIFWGSTDQIFGLAKPISDSIIQGGCPLDFFGNPFSCTNVSAADPLLGVLTDNGGPTKTIALGAGSPAIDTGNACAATDQRGVVRPQGTDCDMGALETDPSAPTLNSFTRKTPATSPTGADTLTFLATFSEAVTGVDAADFAINSSPATTATITDVTQVTASTYDVTIAGGDLAGYNGTVNLNLSGAQNITDIAFNALPAGEPVTDESYTLENHGPATLTFQRKTPASNPTNADTLIFHATFSKDVQNVDAADFEVNSSPATTATVTGVTQVTASTYDVTISGGDLADFDGTINLNLSSSQNITDTEATPNALSPNEPYTDESYTLDNTAPATISFTLKTPATSPTNEDTLTFLATFSEAVTDVDAADFAIDSTTTATITGVTQVTTSTYDLTISGGDLAGFNGTVNLDLSGTQNITDLIGNTLPAGEPATDETYTLDNTAPSTTSFTRKTPSGSPTNADTLTFLATFSEAVTGVDVADFTINSTTTATVTGITQITTSTYDVTVSGGDLAGFNGTVNLDLSGTQNITDLSLNALPAGEPATDETYTLDNTAPSTTSFTRKTPAASSTNADTLTFLATFSEAVTGVDAADFEINSSPATTATITNVTQVTTSTYDVTISGGNLANFDGTVNLNMSGTQNITDLALNALPAGEPATDETYTLDNSAPSVTINQAGTQADPTNTSPVVFTAVFNQPISTATFTNTDITIGGTATTGAVTITEIAPNDNTTFSISVTITGDGTIIPTIPAGGVEDIVGNTNTASTSTDNSVTYDTTSPGTITDGIVGQPNDNTIVDLSAYHTQFTSFEITFSENANDPTGNNDQDDVTNPDNYLLIQAGPDGVYDTTSCILKFNSSDTVLGDDIQIPTGPVTYNAATFTATVEVNNGTPLPVGEYRLLLCGTTSITDLAGNPINNGADSVRTFTIIPAPSNLPETGFRHGEVTQLPHQPAAKAYTDTAMTLEIPKLNVSMPIVGVPQSAEGWDVTWLSNSAGYLSGSAFPTWAGNTVITAHVWDAYNQPGIFSELKTLKYGDQVQIQAWGLTYTYEVRESKLVTKKNVDAAFQSEEYDWLTLVTCEFYNPFNGEYLFRRAVRAVLVSVK